MNAGIYETEHFETVYSLIRFLDRRNKITVFTTLELKGILESQLKGRSDNYTWVLLGTNPIKNFLTIYTVCRSSKIENLVLNTVTKHHILFGFLCLLLSETKTILVIHDANSFFEPRKSLQLRNFIQYIGKKLLAKNIDYFATLLSSSMSYIQTKFKPAQQLICIPGSFLEQQGTIDRSNNSTLKLVVPGAVDNKRRNYDMLLDALSRTTPRYNLEVVFLGGGNEMNKNIMAKFKELERRGISVKTYDQPFIDVQEYDHQLRSCDFILAPLRKHFMGGSEVPEEYGITKSSGTFYDAIRFAKPLIIIGDIFVPEEFRNQCLQYASVQDLIIFFEEVDTAKINQLHQRAWTNASAFTLEKIRQNLPSFLNT